MIEIDTRSKTPIAISVEEPFTPIVKTSAEINDSLAPHPMSARKEPKPLPPTQEKTTYTPLQPILKALAPLSQEAFEKGKASIDALQKEPEKTISDAALTEALFKLWQDQWKTIQNDVEIRTKQVERHHEEVRTLQEIYREEADAYAKKRWTQSAVTTWNVVFFGTSCVLVVGNLVFTIVTGGAALPVFVATMQAVVSIGSGVTSGLKALVDYDCNVTQGKTIECKTMISETFRHLEEQAKRINDVLDMRDQGYEMLAEAVKGENRTAKVIHKKS